MASALADLLERRTDLVLMVETARDVARRS